MMHPPPPVASSSLHRVACVTYCPARFWAIPSWRDGRERHPRPMTTYGDVGSVFDASFGSGSAWGKSTLRSPLLLGIGGSRTYNLI
ncbi:hypothetical protein ACHAXA_007231 [Cyclostephanos tholiformis]|uniref:Uncharacterized protein n=1 Tax=Cyclostephanos tholiformis TaxID=382380 RepID=A0ABD3RJK5_9STRA